jgi:ubiquinone/menaquinone biosynthesis C-methylase UbiE
MNVINDLVEKGYNTIAEDYYNHRDLEKFNSELEKFTSLLTDNAHILDAGCGAGIPTAKFLVNRGIKVTGIDISETMLNLAKKIVPEAKYIKMDINRLNFKEYTFDGIISVYTLFHIPKIKHFEQNV